MYVIVCGASEHCNICRWWEKLRTVLVFAQADQEGPPPPRASENGDYVDGGLPSVRLAMPWSDHHIKPNRLLIALSTGKQLNWAFSIKCALFIGLLRPSVGTVLPPACICKSIMQRAALGHMDLENAWMWHHTDLLVMTMFAGRWGALHSEGGDTWLQHTLICPLSSFFYLIPCPQYFFSSTSSSKSIIVMLFPIALILIFPSSQAPLPASGLQPLHPSGALTASPTLRQHNTG